MAVLHALLVVMALLALICMPGLLALVVTTDIALDDALRAIRRAYRRHHARRVAARLARQVGMRDPGPLPAPAGPPIEQVAADLRRLNGQRLRVANGSPVWLAAVHRAYDEHLNLACRELEVPNNLLDLDGMDLEIERVRVEGLLVAAGLRLRGPEAGRQPGLR